MARTNPYTSKIMLDTKKILAENVAALLGTRPDVSRLNLSKAMKVADGTLGRIKYGTGNPTVDVLEQIAKFFKVETYQLLLPNLGRDLINSPPSRQTFLSFDAKELEALPESEKDEIENILRYKLEKWARSSREQRGAA